MKAYVYNVDTLIIAAEIIGDDNESIETEFANLGYDTDLYGMTYSPAFGYSGGLDYDGDCDIIDLTA